MRLRVHVHPGSRAAAVGSRYGDLDQRVLVVRVREPAVDGRANEAVVRAVADAFGVRRGAVTITSGLSSRTKTLEVTGATEERLAALLNG